MHPLEQKYEQTLLLQLPPQNRDIANRLLEQYSLAELLSMWQQYPPEQALLDTHNTSENDWYPILTAAILAKTTCFIENPHFTQPERLYLIKAACGSAGLPLTKYSLKEVIHLSQNRFPVLHEWLLRLSNQLKSPNL